MLVNIPKDAPESLRPAHISARPAFRKPMTPALQFEILDLRHFSANSLRPVLDSEVKLWNERMRWDYRASADLLLQYLDSRVLPGYVAIEDGRISGYVFCIYEENKAVIGDAFAIPGRGPHTANEIETPPPRSHRRAPHQLPGH